MDPCVHGDDEHDGKNALEKGLFFRVVVTSHIRISLSLICVTLLRIGIFPRTHDIFSILLDT